MSRVIKTYRGKDLGIPDDIVVETEDVELLRIPSYFLPYISTIGEERHDDILFDDSVEIKIKSIDDEHIIRVEDTDGLVAIDYDEIEFFDAVFQRYDKNVRAFCDFPFVKSVVKEVQKRYIEKCFFEKGLIYEGLSLCGFGMVLVDGKTVDIFGQIYFEKSSRFSCKNAVRGLSIASPKESQFRFFAEGDKSFAIASPFSVESGADRYYVSGKIIPIAYVLDPETKMFSPENEESFFNDANNYLRKKEKSTRFSIGDVDFGD